MQKRFQYVGKGGEILWTAKFKCRRNTGMIQHRKLRNEYFQEDADRETSSN